MSFRVVRPVHVALFALSIDAHAQEVVNTAFGQSQFEGFGRSIAGGPDVDGDGVPDVAVGAWTDSNHQGTLFLLSGATLQEITHWTGGTSALLGTSVAWCGDVDGDGTIDLAAGAMAASNGEGRVRLVSPSLGTSIRTISVPGSKWFGACIADAGDFDGDGVHELLVGAPFTKGNWGAAYLVSCRDGSMLFSFGSPLAADNMGASVAVVGDANADGIPDFAVGSPAADATAFNDCAGAVDLFSGADGSLLWRRLGNWSTYYDGYGRLVYTGDRLGFRIAAAGDVDGDGVPDVVASSGMRFEVQVLSGADGSDLRTLRAIAPRPRALAPIGDLDGDGVQEIAVSTGHYVQIASTRDGRWVWRSDDLGSDPTSISSVNDVDGDGRSDFAFGLEEDSTNGSFAGRAELRSSNDLWLDVAPLHRPESWMTLELRAGEGPPGNLAALALTGINGAPLFQLVSFVPFDATGAALLAQTAVPFGFPGLDLSLRALAIDAGGRVVVTAEEHLILP